MVIDLVVLAVAIDIVRAEDADVSGRNYVFQISTFKPPGVQGITNRKPTQACYR
jgi:hypothetical protein